MDGGVDSLFGRRGGGSRIVPIRLLRLRDEKRPLLNTATARPSGPFRLLRSTSEPQRETRSRGTALLS
jgi:hypothetical protein